MARQLGKLGAAGARAGALGAQASAGRAGAGLGCAGASAGRWGAARARGALRHGGLGCDTAGGLGHDTTRSAHDTARRARAWVCPARPILVLVHLAWLLTWFFDSVVFLSHRLDPVHEHCS